MPPTTASYELDYRPSYLAAGITALAVLVLYLVTLAPSTAMWDTSEYIAAAKVLGLPHPPGNPFFVLIGHFFGMLPIHSSYAARVNILAAVCSAGSAMMWFLITERVLVAWLPHRWQRITGGVLAAVIGATAFTVWNQSVVNEKVYTIGLFGLALISWLTVRWADDPDGPKADRILVLIAFLLGLGYSNHMAGMLAAPAVGIAVLIRRWQTILRWKLILYALAAMMLGFTPFATQPIRAAYFPAINEGEPTACATELRADCTFTKLTWDRFKYNFDRGQYGKPSLLERQAPFSAQIGMWWLYFKWQWLRDGDNTAPAWQSILAAFFLVLGLIGGYVHWRRDPRSFSYFGPFMFSVTLLLIYYLNFKYGASQAPDLGESVDREVRDRDYFYLWSFSAWSVWAALGMVYLWETLAALFGADQVKLGKETVEQPRRRSWLMATPVLALALIPLIVNWKWAARAGHTETADFARDMLNSVEPYGILVVVGDNDTFPLWYAQEVEGVRRDVIVANTSLLRTDWYTRQLIRRPIYEYDAAKGPVIFRNRTWTKPSGPPLRMSFDEANAVPEYYPLQAPSLFRKEGTNIAAIIPPHPLIRDELLILQMIKDSYPERPLFFSGSSGNYQQLLGMSPYTVTQGLVRKLLPDTARVGGGIVHVPGAGMVDVARSQALWDSVYTAPESFIRRGHWVDRPSAGIPALYVTSGALLAEALFRQGRPQDAERVIQRAQGVATATGFGQLFTPATQPPPPPAGDQPARTAVPLDTGAPRP